MGYRIRIGIYILNTGVMFFIGVKLNLKIISRSAVYLSPAYIEIPLAPFIGNLRRGVHLNNIRPFARMLIFLGADLYGVGFSCLKTFDFIRVLFDVFIGLLDFFGVAELNLVFNVFKRGAYRPFQTYRISF